MDTESRPAVELEEHQRHEQQLAAALKDLLRQADIGHYRDRQGQELADSPAFQKAQVLVEQFGITHELLCRSLDECAAEGDLGAAARRILEERLARPTDTPPEYDTWHSGP